MNAGLILIITYIVNLLYFLFEIEFIFILEYIINKNCIKNNKAFYYDGNIIFGATAKIINNLLNLLDETV